MFISLLPHPDFPAPAITRVEVTLERNDANLHLTYRIHGDLSTLALPSLQTPIDPERLWAHTCCEIFLAQPESTAYREYNFSPSGQWAAYDFSAYRQKSAWENPPAPRMEWRRENDELRLRVTLPVAAQSLQLALSVVLELTDGRLAYYALRHPAGAPDFHHRSAFTLNLTPTHIPT
ncbi:hypothetical protein AGMMS49545_03650 [Betaproteobacteria bacterium]|nr:hypothetical protein AGMMS49545_03650 [Betaproteobacteria bacterium]GHU41726.1 hypothetical protein AGMMS50289_05330 [Betaproteobacteria bacterium]